jgi:multicomponent K+:H+ antiporter subunit G
MTLYATIAIAFFLIIGTIFTLVAGIGLLKLNNSMSRLHAPTKAGTVGMGSFLMASLINSWTFGTGSFHELLIMVFLFLTAPVSANFMAKVNIHRGVCDTLPSPANDTTWSTLNIPPEDRDIVPYKD